MKALSKFSKAIIGFGSLLPSAVYAQISEGDINQPLTPVKNADLIKIIVDVVNYLLILAGALAVLFLIIGGVRYIISAGNSDQIESAKHTIFNAIIGIIVIILALVILNTVKRLLGT